MMRIRRTVPAALLVVFLAAVALAAVRDRPAGRAGVRRPPRRFSGGLKVGQKAPDFELPILVEKKNDKGEKIAVITKDKVKLSSYRGKKIVCIFMSSYT